ncbi:MAG TPA: hypothetical protein DC049_03510 [Spirochaetia bacterium]|nr:hypothetical protein [Spirochaetia bacterium]
MNEMISDKQNFFLSIHSSTKKIKCITLALGLSIFITGSSYATESHTPSGSTSKINESPTSVRDLVSCTSGKKGKRFGFLDVYGQSRDSLYNIWKDKFGMDLIAESSRMANDLGIGWIRLSFWYPKNKLDSYSRKKYDQAVADGLDIFATIYIDEKDHLNENAYVWLETIVSEYSSKIKYWQVHNEVGKPNRYAQADTYIELLARSSSTIKKACPDCSVVMGSTLPNKNYYTLVIDKGDSYVDAYDFHIFFAEDMPSFKDFSSRVHKPIFITEMATHSGQPQGSRRMSAPYHSEREQAQTLIKWYTQAFSSGAGYIFWSQFVEWFGFMGQIDGLFDFTGIVYNGMCDSPATDNVCRDSNIDKGAGVKKEAYYSLKALISKIGNFSAVEQIAEWRYKFTVDGKSVYVVWCDSSSGRLLSELRGPIKVTDYLGKEATVQADSLRLSESPVFIETD